MKYILGIIFISFTSYAFAGVPPSLNDAIFVADYDDGLLIADKARGSPAATFARVGGATKPATYFDRNGIMQVTTVNNDPRFNYGYYNATGWHTFTKSGLMVEGVETNHFSKSYEFDHSDWTKSNIEVSANTVLSVDGATNAETIGAGEANSTILQAETLSSDIYTFSVWMKRKTGTGTVSITSRGSGGWTSVTVTDSWGRFVTSSTVTNPSGGVKIDTVLDEVYIYGAQVETNSFVSSFIPTTTAALTRNLETLKYEIAGNRSASVESCVVKFAPEYSSTSTSTTKFITSTDTKVRNFSVGFSNDVQIYPNATDEIGCAVSDIINDTWTAHTEMTVGYTCQSGTSPYAAGYWDGIADGTNETADDFTTNAWGTYFWIGSNEGGGEQLNGTIFSVAFWDRVLNFREMESLHDIDWEAKAFHKGGMGKRNGLGLTYKPQMELR